MTAIRTYEDGVRDGFRQAQEIYQQQLMKLAVGREVRIYAMNENQVASFVRNHTTHSDEVIIANVDQSK